MEKWNWTEWNKKKKKRRKKMGYTVMIFIM